MLGNIGNHHKNGVEQSTRHINFIRNIAGHSGIPNLSKPSATMEAKLVALSILFTYSFVAWLFGRIGIFAFNNWQTLIFFLLASVSFSLRIYFYFTNRRHRDRMNKMDEIRKQKEIDELGF